MLVTRSGDYSDVRVIDAEGREIPWNHVSRISQDEMKTPYGQKTHAASR
jgi:hypothetical protein